MQNGYVVIRFDLDPRGAPIEIEVTKSEPPGLFDAAAVEALAEWRYCAGTPERSGLEVRLDFNLRP